MAAALEQLADPPIVEVICGFFFDAPNQLDPLLLAEYSKQLEGDYPRREFVPALLPIPQGSEPLQVDPLRLLRLQLTSGNDERVLQIQHDRMYVNWRARGAHYPRFRSRPDGLMTAALRSFEAFQSFLQERLGQTVGLTGIQLSKIDHFVEGRHWVGREDLQKLLPLTTTLSFADTEEMRFRLDVEQKRDDGALLVRLFNSAVEGPAGHKQHVVRLETLSQKRVLTGNQCEKAFLQMNEDVNAAFAALVPPEQRAIRFGGGET